MPCRLLHFQQGNNYMPNVLFLHFSRIEALVLLLEASVFSFLETSYLTLSIIEFCFYVCALYLFYESTDF